MTICYVELDFTEKICSRLAWRGLGKLQILVWVPLSDSLPDVTLTTTSGQKENYTLTWGQTSCFIADLLNSQWTLGSQTAHAVFNDMELDWSMMHNFKMINVTRAHVASTIFFRPVYAHVKPNCTVKIGHYLDPLGLHSHKKAINRLWQCFRTLWRERNYFGSYNGTPREPRPLEG